MPPCGWSLFHGRVVLHRGRVLFVSVLILRTVISSMADDMSSGTSGHALAGCQFITPTRNSAGKLFGYFEVVRGNRDNLLLFLRRDTFIVRSLFLAWTLTRCTTTWPTTSTRCATASTVVRRALSARRPSASLTKEKRMGSTADGGTPCTAPDPNRSKSPSLRCLQPGVHDVNVEQDMAQYGVRSCVSWRRVRAHALGGGVRGRNDTSASDNV